MIGSASTVSASPDANSSTGKPKPIISIPNLKLHTVTHFDPNTFNPNPVGRARLPLSPSSDSDDERAQQQAKSRRPLERLLLAISPITQQLPLPGQACRDVRVFIPAPKKTTVFAENFQQQAEEAHIRRLRQAHLGAASKAQTFHSAVLSHVSPKKMHVDVRQGENRNTLKAELSLLIPGITQDLRTLPQKAPITLLVRGLLCILDTYAKRPENVPAGSQVSDLRYLTAFKDGCTSTSPLYFSIQTAIQIIKKLHSS